MLTTILHFLHILDRKPKNSNIFKVWKDVSGNSDVPSATATSTVSSATGTSELESGSSKPKTCSKNMKLNLCCLQGEIEQSNNDIKVKSNY